VAKPFKALKTAKAPAAPAEPLKLDLGCGPNKHPGFHGVDAIDFVGVDTVLNLVARFEDGSFVPWPWADGSVSEAFSSHFLEHLTNPERVHFWNELHRVLVPGGKALIIAPHYSNACAYGDPTHQWPPISEWLALYLDKDWRAVNAPHAGLTCDFSHVAGFSFDHRVLSWNTERQTFGLTHHLNAARDLHITVTKK
jgi:SAM-dependent methyltransferase